jgi:hypothetical protein
MKYCPYCKRVVLTEEPDSLYYIEEDESITWAHMECLETFEGVQLDIVIDSFDDNQYI